MIDERFFAEQATVSNATEYHDVPSSDAVRMGEIFQLPPSVSGYPVTAKTAMRISAVYACVRLLAGAMAMLPVSVLEETKDGDQIERRNHRVWRLLNTAPNLRWTAATFWEFIVAAVMLKGDGFAWIERERTAAGVTTSMAKALHPVHPDMTAIEVRNGVMYYTFTLEDGSQIVKEQSDVLHFPGFGFNGVRSMSVIQHGALSAISIAGSAEQHTGRFMKGGGSHKFALKAPKALNKGQREHLADQFAEKYGSPDLQKPLVLTEGLEVANITMTQADAQMLESRRFQVEDIARAFGVPPFMLGSTDKVTSWGSGIEQMGRGFLIYTLSPHITRFEQELNRKLLGQGHRWAEFQPDGLARADLKTRSDAYQKALGGNNGPGWMTVDEVRRKERLVSRGGDADELYRPPAGSEPDDEPDDDKDKPPVEPNTETEDEES